MLTQKLQNIAYLLLFFSNYSHAITWEYRDWTTRPSDNGGYTMNANGQVIAGHTLQLGFVGDKCNSPDHLSLTWSSYEKGLAELTGNKIQLTVDIDGASYFLEMTLVDSYAFTPLMDVAILSASAIPKTLFEQMKSGQTVSFEIVGPPSAIEKFDISGEVFELNGFTANAAKVESACLNSVQELEIPPRMTNEELALLELKKFNESKLTPNKPTNVLDSSASKTCGRPLNLNVAQNLISLGVQTIASFDDYFVIAESRDGSHPYPPIQIFNACDPMDLLPVVAVPGTAQQVFDLIISGERLYALSNNRSVLGLYDLEKPDVLLQVIDISDLNNVTIVGELEFNGLVPEMAVFGDQVFIAEGDSVRQIDASNFRNLRWTEKTFKFDVGKTGISDLAVSQELMFAIGTKGLQVRDTTTGELKLAQYLPNQPGRVFVNDKGLLLGLPDRTLVFPITEESSSIDSIHHPGQDPSWFQLENLLIDRYGQIAVDLNDPTNIFEPQ